MEFFVQPELFFRAAAAGLAPLAARQTADGDPWSRLLQWLDDPSTEFVLRVSYPRLAARTYPLNDAKRATVRTDRELARVYFDLQARCRESTTPLGAFVIVGRADLGLSSEPRSPSFKDVNVALMKNDISTSNEAPLRGEDLLSCHPLILEKGQVVHALALAECPIYEAYCWQTWPKRKTISELLQLLREPTTVKEAVRFLKGKGYTSSESAGILQALITSRVIQAQNFRDRFTMIPPVAQFAGPEIASRGVEFLRNWDPAHSLDAAVVATSTTSMNLSRTTVSEIEFVSRFVIAQNLAVQGGAGPIDRFREAFHSRYDTNTASLVEVLDPLKGIALLSLAENPEQKLPDALLQSAVTAVLDRQPLILDRQQMTSTIERHLTPSMKVPGFATAFMTIAKNTGKLPEIWLRKIYGHPSNRPVGRFERFLGASTTHSPVLPPGYIWAEIGGAPQGRFRNLVELPLGDRYYIDCLNTPRLGERVIKLQDLVLVHLDGHMMLWNKKLCVYVIPTFTNAANTFLDLHPAVALLRLIATQFTIGDFEFNWSQQTGMVHRPRVVFGNTVISPEERRVPSSLVLEKSKGSPKEVRSWFESLLPPSATRAEIRTSGTSLCFDLDSPTLRESLRKVARSDLWLDVREMGASQEMGVQFQGRELKTEFILPFVNKRYSPPGQSFERPLAAAARARTDVLALSILSSQDGQTRLLGILETALRDFGVSWFYVRLKDNLGQPVLKLRLLFSSTRERERLLGAVTDILESKLARQLYFSYTIESYLGEPEVYRGKRLHDLYFKMSSLDSTASIKALRAIGAHSQCTLATYTAAWSSALQYARLFPSASLRRSSQGRGLTPLSKEDRLLLAQAKLDALESLKNGGSPLSHAFQARADLEKRTGLAKTFAREKPGVQNLFFSRAVHLSLNRLNPAILAPCEAAIVSQSLQCRDL